MTDYRYLTDNEIAALEGNGCKAENWDDVETAEGFVAGNYRNVEFYGRIRLGNVDGMAEISPGFYKNFGVYYAAQREHRRQLPDREHRQLHQRIFHRRQLPD